MPPRFLLLCLASLGAVAFLAWPPARRTPSSSPAVSHPMPAVPSAKVVGVPEVEPGQSAAVAPAPVIRVSAGSPDRAEVIGGPAMTVGKVTKQSSAAIRSDAHGRPASTGQARVDALGNREVRLDNGVVATTTKDALGGSTTRFSNGVVATSRTDALGGTTTTYSNGVTASSRRDAFGNVDTTYSDGTRSTTRTDPFGNQVTTFSDGRTETIRPDPFAPKAKDGRK